MLHNSQRVKIFPNQGQIRTEPGGLKWIFNGNMIDEVTQHLIEVTFPNKKNYNILYYGSPKT
jgi:hypothetical protein